MCLYLDTIHLIGGGRGWRLVAQTEMPGGEPRSMRVRGEVRAKGFPCGHDAASRAVAPGFDRRPRDWQRRPADSLRKNRSETDRIQTGT